MIGSAIGLGLGAVLEIHFGPWPLIFLVTSVMEEPNELALIDRLLLRVARSNITIE